MAHKSENEPDYDRPTERQAVGRLAGKNDLRSSELYAVARLRRAMAHKSQCRESRQREPTAIQYNRFGSRYYSAK